MINCTEIKPGQCFTWEGTLYQCIDIALNKTAMAKMKVKVKVKEKYNIKLRVEQRLVNWDKKNEK